MEENKLPAEQFPALSARPELRHCFTTRVRGIDVQADKTEALERLDQAHRAVRNAIGLGERPFATAQQVHGCGIGVIDAPMSGDKCFDACDGLITNQRDVCLGIYVADCCALYLVDTARPVLGLVHSGRKGTELGIATEAIRLMGERFGSRPEDILAQLSPCIRPPHYEVDFAADIVASCRAAGVAQIQDSGVCTACELGRYYSYRAEKGKTGRMLALMGWD